MNQVTTQNKVLGGFESPVFDSQATFRALLRANSYPGQIEKISVGLNPPEGMDTAAAAICLTLLDFEVNVWLDSGFDSEEISSYLGFHCGCTVTPVAEKADFVLISDLENLPELSMFKIGTSELPDRSATMIIRVPEISGDAGGMELTGPGIETTKSLKIPGIPEAFWQERRDMAEMFPQGIDLIFTANDKVCALPRSTVFGG